MTEGAWYTDLDAFLKEHHGSRTVYNRFRIPKPPPVEDTISQPGHLCWGSVGALPTAQPAPGAGFNIVEPEERHEEIDRRTVRVRIENPDNPNDYVFVDRSEEILFLQKHPGWKKATGAGSTDAAADFGDFAPTPIELSSFRPLGEETQSNLIVKFKNVPGSNQT